MVFNSNYIIKMEGREVHTLSILPERTHFVYTTKHASVQFYWETARKKASRTDQDAHVRPRWCSLVLITQCASVMPVNLNSKHVRGLSHGLTVAQHSRY